MIVPSRRWILAACALPVLYIALTTRSRADDDPKPLQVCLVSGSLEYKSNESLAAFQQYLEAHYPRQMLAGLHRGHRRRAFAGTRKPGELRRDAAVHAPAETLGRAVGAY